MEFEGPSYEEQKQHLQRCQQLAKEKLGFPFASFGAPFNLRDDMPDFKVWMYGDGQFPVGGTVLVRRGDVNIENSIFVPSTQKLAAGMAKHSTAPYFVIQGHPPRWDAARLAEFEKMLDDLIAQHAVFVTPSELAATLPPPVQSKLVPIAVGPAVATGTPTGDNLVTNGDFHADLDGWTLDHIQNTPADPSIENLEAGKHAAHVEVPQAAEKRYFV